MKFDCGPTPEQRAQAKKDWHRWYAWFPVRVGPHDCRWLETVERKGEFVDIDLELDVCGWLYEYRPAHD